MDNSTLMSLRIQQKRKEKGLTLQELGDMLGVYKSAVNKWEKGTVKNIKQSTIKKMAEIFDCSPAWLMGIDDITVEVEQRRDEEIGSLLALLETTSSDDILMIGKLLSLPEDKKAIVFNQIDYLSSLLSSDKK